MSESTKNEPRPGTGGEAALRVRLPRFVRDDEIGLGDVVTRVTYALGIKPCGGCQARAAVMNHWVAFTR